MGLEPTTHPLSCRLSVTGGTQDTEGGHYATAWEKPAGDGCSWCPGGSRAHIQQKPVGRGFCSPAWCPGTQGQKGCGARNGKGLRTEPAVQPGWFAAPPSLPQWSGPAPSLLSASIPRRALLPRTRGIRRTRRHTSLFLYTNRAGIRTQCCPRQEGGRQTEREGDIREVTQNRLRLYGRKQAATTTVRGEDSAVSHGRAESTAHWDRPRRDNTVPVPQLLAQMVPLPHPTAGAHLGAHRRPLSHRTVPRGGCGPKRRKEGKDRDTRVREEEREGGPSSLCMNTHPPCPALTLPTGRKWEPCPGQERSSHTPGLRDTAPQTLPALQPRRQLRPPRQPLPGRKTSTGGSLSDRVRLRLSPQPPSCSTSSTEGGRLPGTSRERGPSAPAQPMGAHGRGGPRFSM